MKVCLKGIIAVFLILFISSSALAEVTFPAPDFSLLDLYNNTVSLSSYKDKQNVILFFWTTGCPLCKTDLKLLSKMYPEFFREKVEVLAINIGEPRYKVERFIKYYNFAVKVLLDRTASVAYTYRVLGLPTYVLIDKKGNIRSIENEFPAQEYKSLISGKNE